MDLHSEIETYWDEYLATLPDQDAPQMYSAWSFGNTPELADRLGKLVVSGLKTATSSLIWDYETNHEPIPKAGDISIILNGKGNPICIIETREVTVQPFLQVSESIAYDEGEGDRSLAYWRQVHWDVFSATCKILGREPTEQMPVVCERFRVVYR